MFINYSMYMNQHLTTCMRIFMYWLALSNRYKGTNTEVIFYLNLLMKNISLMIEIGQVNTLFTIANET